MKKIFFFTLLLISVGYSGNAQAISILVSAGGTYANTYIKSDTGKAQSLGAKNGFRGGVSANVPINRHFSFQPGVNFLQKGFKNEATATDLTLNYIELPLTMMFNTHNKDLGGKRADNFFFGIGPSVAVGVSGEKKYNTFSGPIKEAVIFGNNIKKDFKGIDAGANAEMGCLFVSNVFFNISYNVSFSSISESKDIKWRNKYLGFKIGYSFGGNKK